jgi:hypothetical protein
MIIIIQNDFVSSEARSSGLLIPVGYNPYPLTRARYPGTRTRARV